MISAGGNNNNMRESINEMLINRMRKKNSQKDSRTSNNKPVYSIKGKVARQMAPEKQRRLMHYNNKKLFKMMEKIEEDGGKTTD